jgi:hypothetical protein
MNESAFFVCFVRHVATSLSKQNSLLHALGIIEEAAIELHQSLSNGPFHSDRWRELSSRMIDAVDRSLQVIHRSQDAQVGSDSMQLCAQVIRRFSDSIHVIEREVHEANRPNTRARIATFISRGAVISFALFWTWKK